jgi:hypothetical protein
MNSNLALTNDMESSIPESQIIQFVKIPWIFRRLIPTQLDVDGIKFPLTPTIDTHLAIKSYGHYRLRLVCFGFIKTKALVVATKKSTIWMDFKISTHNWLRYLISILVLAYLVLSRPRSKQYLFIALTCLSVGILFDFIIQFFRIYEAVPPSENANP